MKVHWSKSKILGKTLCGRLVEYNGIVGNVYMNVTCKVCKKMHKIRQKQDKE